jgi:hypothetical protein
MGCGALKLLIKLRKERGKENVQLLSKALIKILWYQLVDQSYSQKTKKYCKKVL